MKVTRAFLHEGEVERPYTNHLERGRFLALDKLFPVLPVFCTASVA